MASNPAPNSPERDLLATEENREDAFRVSASPVIPARNGNHHAPDGLDLPRSYGLETLWLLPRDPHSLFAYWDIDWKAVFGEENPRPRKVHLRLLAEDDSERAKVEVEPMAGQCSVRLEQADASYRGEIGYVDLAGAWQVVGRSASISLPPETEGKMEPGDFATVPLHLSFQRMLDATRDAEEKNHSLTGTLSQLRERAAADQTSPSITAQQREVIRAIEDAAARHPAPPPRSTAAPDLWALPRLERIFGFGHASLSGGFGSSGRSM